MEAAKIIRAQLETLSADDEDLARDMIEGETSLVETIAHLVAHEGEDKAVLAGLDVFADALETRKARIKARIETRRALLGSALEIAGLTKLETPTGTVALSKVAPKAIILEEADIPSQFWKTGKPTLDKKALTDALKSEQQIPGAMLSNGGVTVTIRRR